MAVAHTMIKKEIAHVNDDETIEIRSWWKHAATPVNELKEIQHQCTEGQDVIIPLFPFDTVYGKSWCVGGCAVCGHLYYYMTPVVKNDTKS